MKKKLALVLAVVLVFGATVGATLAWLQDTSNDVVNTFTVGDINIALDETDVDDSTADKERDTANEYKILPGNSYVKDPKVTVTAKSEECYIFVEIIEDHNTYTGLTGKVIQYIINTADWTPVAANSNVYYYKTTVDASEEANDVLVDSTVLATDDDGNNITINSGLTKEMLTAISANKPTITFKAYAVQAANMDDAVDAWTQTFGATE